VLKQFFTSVTRNYLSLAGTALTTATAVLIVTFIVLELFGFHGGPYLGILTFIILPAIFVFGLLLIPTGVLMARRKAHKAAAKGETVGKLKLPIIDLNKASTRNVVLVVALLTMVNVVILAASTFKGVEVMDSTEFCGTSCHTVMEPEYTAYQRSPHARVDCVDCHIGPGADWFVKSKISGAWQLVSVAFDLYPRPIPTPVHDLRPSRETCEQCHWPEKFVGDKLRVITHYEEDEANSELKTVLLLKVGGIQGRSSQGIHWHVDPGNEIRYLSDETRETIYDVELTMPDGSKKVYKSGDAPADATWRTMDCVDCHNRPTHVYRRPDAEIDLSITEGRIDSALPYIKREGMTALRGKYESHDQARVGIAAAIRDYYGQAHPAIAAEQATAIDAAATELGNIYSYNVFPAMNVDWDTYPNHIGHESSPGCFRCHDKKHRASGRDRISKDCETCHTLLAEDETEPDILKQLQP